MINVNKSFHSGIPCSLNIIGIDDQGRQGQEFATGAQRSDDPPNPADISIGRRPDRREIRADVTLCQT